MALCIIVDDHEDTREGYAEYLGACGLSAVTAGSAEELYAMATAAPPDVIVLDLQLPGMDGWEVARRIRANPSLHTIPIVAVSGCVLPADREEAEHAGCDVFLAKPCDPGVIVSEVRRLLFRSSRQ
jgi:two-component system cell cycle response regulator DivK